jgi:hypothetical protein
MLHKKKEKKREESAAAHRGEYYQLQTFPREL